MNPKEYIKLECSNIYVLHLIANYKLIQANFFFFLPKKCFSKF
ncbi:hypothetical protein CsSME_00039541 [Camellia sinensis var. sinensis]